jgi:protein-L-isoaspartate(D-aspartate) O-methyltransferase
LQAVPREDFVPESLKALAHENRPLSIGCEQTISQPYIVALMTQLVLAGKNHLGNVLEIGTGSGYQAAVLSGLVDNVYTIERIHVLYANTTALLAHLGYKNIHCCYDDGNLGWAEHSPYDGILVTSAAAKMPLALLEQLAVGGRMVIPIEAKLGQMLQVITKQEKGFITQDITGVRFVPLLEGRD